MTRQAIANILAEQANEVAGRRGSEGQRPRDGRHGVEATATTVHLAGAGKDDIDFVALLVIAYEEIHVRMVEDRPVAELEVHVTGPHADLARERVVLHRA